MPPGEQLAMEITEDMRARLQHLPTPEEALAKVHLYGLLKLRHYFGDKALEAVKLGLSRPIRPSRHEAEKLISDWERRDKACCFHGSAEEVCSLPGTAAIAVSYKHLPQDEWKRNGTDRVSKMAQSDVDLLCQFVELQKYHCNLVILWCDQVISTRLQGMENNLGWYNAGLLPFMSMKVLLLSPHVSDQQLENRIWIRAERSLARMTTGFITSSEVQRGSAVGCTGREAPCDEAVMNLSRMILSGYWPPDMGYWAQDYMQMKRWAFGVVTRSTEFLTMLFDHHERIENVEILRAMPALALIPTGLEKEEPIFKTDNKLFWLKASAWNPAVRDIWNEDAKLVSHFMGSMGAGSRFSWWTTSDSLVLFGCLQTLVDAITVLAIQDDGKYLLYRTPGDRNSYKHAERYAGPETKKMIQTVAQRAGINLADSIEFHLLYTSDDSLITAETQKALQNLVNVKAADADVSLSEIFTGMTTKLFLSAVAKEGQENASMVAEKICKAVEEWNSHIRSHWSEWISVKDAVLGPIWLEGYDDDWVSFGFLEFLTYRVIADKEVWPKNRVSLRTVSELCSELLRYAKSDELEEDKTEVFNALYESMAVGSCQNYLNKKDAARFLLHGGFSKEWTPGVFSMFLSRSAQEKGFWTTMIQCRHGKLQIRFWDGRGGCRIAQRSTLLKDFTSKGLVHPEDYDAVASTSIVLDRSERRSCFLEFWKDMEDTCTFDIMWSTFKHVFRKKDGNPLLLVDMTTKDASGNEGQIVWNKDHILIARELDYSGLIEDTRRVAMHNFSMKQTQKDLQKITSDCDQQQSENYRQLHNLTKLVNEIKDGNESFVEHPELDEALHGFPNAVELHRNTSDMDAWHREMTQQFTRAMLVIEDIDEKYKFGLQRLLHLPSHHTANPQHGGASSSKETEDD